MVTGIGMEKDYFCPSLFRMISSHRTEIHGGDRCRRKMRESPRSDYMEFCGLSFHNSSLEL